MIFFKKIIVYILFIYPRILKFKALSTGKRIDGKPILYQAVQMNGAGCIRFAQNVRLGVNPSPFLHSGYIYIDARNSQTEIIFGSDIWVNNNCSFIAEGEGIEIGDNTLIGTSCEIVDSDFHDSNPETRWGGQGKTGKVVIGQNVFLGSNVKVMKGVTIGNNSVIGNSSVVTKSIPANVIAVGVPARVIKNL